MNERAVFSNTVESGVHVHCSMKNLSSFSIFLRNNDGSHYTIWKFCTACKFVFRVYHLILLDGDWINETCQVEEVCNVIILVEGRRGHQFISQ